MNWMFKRARACHMNSNNVLKQINLCSNSNLCSISKIMHKHKKLLNYLRTLSRFSKAIWLDHSKDMVYVAAAYEVVSWLDSICGKESWKAGHYESHILHYDLLFILYFAYDWMGWNCQLWMFCTCINVSFDEMECEMKAKIRKKMEGGLAQSYLAGDLHHEFIFVSSQWADIIQICTWMKCRH